MSDDREPTAKVLFRVPVEDGEAMVETLWAIPLGDDQYELANSPFYAYGVSWQDIVLAPFNADEGFPTFERVVKKSGNHMVRVVFPIPVDSGNEPDRILDGLEALGCSFEGLSSRYFSINIPPGIELATICDFLSEREVEWEHADPSYSELHPQKS
jgi:hypothetical protein